MLWTRVSAAMAMVLALLGIVLFFIPLFYSKPMQFGAGDAISAVGIVALIAGAFFAIVYADLFALTFAWSWSLALKASTLVHTIINVPDYARMVSRFESDETREHVRQLLERGHQVDIQLAWVGFALPLIGLILLWAGHLRIAQKRSEA